LREPAPPERPVDLDEPAPAPEKKDDDYVRLTLRGVSQPAKGAEVELPKAVHMLYQGKNITLETGAKGKVMTRGCANHIVMKAKHWSFASDLLLEDVK